MTLFCVQPSPFTLDEDFFETATPLYCISNLISLQITTPSIDTQCHQSNMTLHPSYKMYGIEVLPLVYFLSQAFFIFPWPKCMFLMCQQPAADQHNMLFPLCLWTELVVLCFLHSCKFNQPFILE